jgi:streptogramin lyase
LIINLTDDVFYFVVGSIENIPVSIVVKTLPAPSSAASMMASATAPAAAAPTSAASSSATPANECIAIDAGEIFFAINEGIAYELDWHFQIL